MSKPLTTLLFAHYLNSFSGINITITVINQFFLISWPNERPLIYDHNKVKHAALLQFS